MSDYNLEKNKEHYESLYRTFPVDNILYWLQNLDTFLEKAISTETSWFGLYQGDFRSRIKGKRVLELGCGDCTNAAVMAALGAEVYANDLAAASGAIVREINKNCIFDYPIVFIEGDFLQNDLSSDKFDFVIGKAFLHHLIIPVEELFLEEIARLLKQEGEARFFEPAVNSKLLDAIRWSIPMGKRPSKFNKSAFRKWKEEDPHPNRPLSSYHWELAGEKWFEEVEIVPIGTLDRFGRLFKWGKFQSNVKKWALKTEMFLPHFLNRKFCRSQLVIFRRLKCS